MAWDWDAIGKTVREGLDTAAMAAVTYAGWHSFNQDMNMPLDAALERMTERARTMTPEALDRYECLYLAYARTAVDPEHHTRALHLYAWLKLNELQRFGTFRGFGHAALPHEL
jgi:hypothetical protein